MRCFQGEHWGYIVPGSVLFVLFTALCARLIRAGGELQNIEMTLNLLDWRGDSKKKPPYAHALSARSSKHAEVTVAVKTVAVLATTFMGTGHPIAVAAVRTLCAHPCLDSIHCTANATKCYAKFHSS